MSTIEDLIDATLAESLPATGDVSVQFAPTEDEDQGDAPTEHARGRAAFFRAVGGLEGLRAAAKGEVERGRRIVEREARQTAAKARAGAKGMAQCGAMTKAGDRCTKPADPGRKMCRQHHGAPKFTRAVGRMRRLGI